MALLGEAYATAGNLTGDRHFYFTARSVAPSGGANGDQAYKMVADSGKYAIELHYWTHTTGLLAPGAPATLELLIYANDGTLWRTVHAAGAPPAQGSVGKFFGTVDGLVATALRSGAAELYIRAQVGGIGAYNVNSRDASGHEGVVLAPMEIASITYGTANNDTYDNGSPWSRGVAADENVRINVNHTEPKVSDASQQGRVTLPDASTGGGPVATNYAFVNPGAETGDLTGWVQTVVSTGADTDNVRTGTYAFGITGVNTNYPKYLHQDHDVSAQATAIDVGDTTAGITTYLYPAFTGDEAILRFECYDDQLGTTLLGTFDSSTLSPNLGNVTQGVFNEVSHSATIPTGTRMVRFVYIWNASGGAQGNMAWDDTGDLIVTVPGTGDLIGTTQQAHTSPFTDDFLVGDDFKEQLGTYGAVFTLLGNSSIAPDSGNIPWTFLVDGGGTGLTVNDDTNITRAVWVNVDPRITVANLTSDEDDYNVRELTGTDCNVQNARLQNITRSLTIHLADSQGTIKASSTQAIANRNVDYQTVNGDDSAPVVIGAQWTVHAEDTGTYDSPSVNAFKLSTYKAIHNAATLPTPGDPTSANGNILTTRAGASSNTVLNFGQSILVEFWAYGVRGQLLQNVTSPSAVIRTINSLGFPEAVSPVTLASGKVSATYAPALSGSGHLSVADAVGDLKHIRFEYGDSDNIDSNDGFGLSSFLTPDDSEFGDGIWTGKSDNDLDANGQPDNAEFSQFFVGADVMYAKAKLLDAAGDAYVGATITMDLLRGATLEQGPFNTGVTQAPAITGWQDIFYSFQVLAPSGERTLRVSAANGDNAMAQESVTVTFSPSYTGNLYFRAVMERDGNALRVAIQPIIWLASDNSPQKLSEVTPTPVVDVVPKGDITKFNGVGSDMTQASAQEAFTQTTGDNDDWENVFDITGYSDGLYSLNLVMTINGGQEDKSIEFELSSGTVKALTLSSDGSYFREALVKPA